MVRISECGELTSEADGGNGEEVEEFVVEGGEPLEVDEEVLLDDLERAVSHFGWMKLNK